MGGRRNATIRRLIIRDRAAARERAAVVAFVRREARDWSDGTEVAFANLADAIERGDHITTSEDRHGATPSTQEESKNG